MEDTTSSALSASPIVRIMKIILEYAKIVSEIPQGSQKKFESILELYDHVDRSDKDNILRPIGEILEFCYSYLDRMQKQNKVLNFNLEIRKHFEQLFDMQKKQIQKRLPYGYLSPYGMPAYGNPLLGRSYHPSSNYITEPNLDISRDYSPSKEVTSWFKFRHYYLFGFPPKEQIKQELKNSFNYPYSYEENETGTIITNYSMMVNDAGKVMIVVDDKYLTVSDSADPKLVHEIIDFEYDFHSFTHIKITNENTKKYNEFTIVICPFMIRDNYNYRHFVEALIRQKYNEHTKELEDREIGFVLMNKSTQSIFEDNTLSMEQRIEKISRSQFTYIIPITSKFSGLLTAYKRQAEAGILDESVKSSFCTLCWNRASAYQKDILELLNKAIRLDENRKYDEALGYLDKALEKKTNDAFIMFYKGKILVTIQRYEEAIIYFDKALEIDPNHAQSLHGKGYALSELQRYEEAIIYFDKALEIDPLETTILFYQSIAKLMSGDKEACLNLLKQAIDKDVGIKESAKKNKHFERLKDDEEFRKLVYDNE